MAIMGCLGSKISMASVSAQRPMHSSSVLPFWTDRQEEKNTMAQGGGFLLFPSESSFPENLRK